jgi:hypothetical protein
VKGPDLLATLERAGFTVSRRSKSFVWLVRGEDQLLIDVNADIEDNLAREIIAHATRPPS